MKLFTVSAILFAAGTQACALYQLCHCTNADGTPDDVATVTACYEQSEPHKEMIGVSGFEECHFTGSAQSGFLRLEENGLSNCKFREACTAAGATGEDSNCSGKMH
ncbi:hypothetical protein N8I77_010761 [Diaporthe amygdali]|uniref:Uncharacterized protein n=1 Tax=Phomopsis amygdali TaxID=1214568 RepID=A0AAD9VZG8_PHOAM|nr:uncharacterized protein J7T55_012271 [Diaporthe amygdali]KAJ0123801.1 hypothetical protein J7T55_012271 [Diaporthe amygdali]KAK2601301.1 hypothetical protein N8I77_010761 [Diaporthe amygdali]